MTRNGLASPSPQHTDDAAEIFRRESSILAALHDAVFVLDCNGIVTAWTRGAERTFGYRSTEAIGLPIAFLRFPEDLPYHRETFLSSALERGFHRATIRCRHKDGRQIFVELRLAPLRDTTGIARNLVGCVNAVRQDSPSGMERDQSPCLAFSKAGVA